VKPGAEGRASVTPCPPALTVVPENARDRAAADLADATAARIGDIDIGAMNAHLRRPFDVAVHECVVPAETKGGVRRRPAVAGGVTEARAGNRGEVPAADPADATAAFIGDVHIAAAVDGHASRLVEPNARRGALAGVAARAVPCDRAHHAA